MYGNDFPYRIKCHMACVISFLCGKSAQFICFAQQMFVFFLWHVSLSQLLVYGYVNSICFAYDESTHPSAVCVCGCMIFSYHVSIFFQVFFFGTGFTPRRLIALALGLLQNECIHKC